MPTGTFFKKLLGLQNEITTVKEVSLSKDNIKKYPFSEAQFENNNFVLFCACNRGLFLLEKGIGIAKNTPYITKLKPFFGKK